MGVTSSVPAHPLPGGPLYAGREVYANAPLELVAAEIKFTYVPSLARDRGRESFAGELRDLTPVPKLEKFHTLSFGPTNEGTQGEQEQFRLLNRDSTLSVVLDPQRVVIETTRYSSFDDFRVIVDRAVGALAQNHDIAGVERIGLRYIDEIRVPVEIKSARDWYGWVDDRLLAALDVRPDDLAETLQTVIEYRTQNERILRFRFGSINGPSLVGDEPLRKRRKYAPGPYFLLDLDSFWQATEQTPAFDGTEVMRIIDSLHLPTGETFAASITEQLKTHVLRKDARDA